MSAIPEDFIKTTARLSDQVTRPFASSRKVYVTGSRADIRVPMREISLAASEPPVRLYDTSGPRVSGHEEGLPHLREEWIAARSGDRTPTQLHYARKGEITQEMYFAAAREGLEPGQRVITKGFLGLQEGKAVNPVNQSTATEKG